MIDCIAIPTSHCRFGLAQADITPPVGIYHRMWGAATHDRATGVHRPLTASALAFAPLDAGRLPFVLVALDHCLLWPEMMASLRQTVMTAHGMTDEQLLVTFSHTHAAGLMDPSRGDLPGGDLIAPYLAELLIVVVDVVGQALSALRPATISYATGRCTLAAHRDAWDQSSQQFVCGLNPEGFADDTVLVGRITGDDGRLLATVVNYACHPTTLAWDNTLISPDYPGAMREVIERQTGAPCVFLLGACGDLGPRDGFVGDVAVADRNGRELGYAALAAFESLGPAGTDFVYAGPVVSGATLGTWKHEPLTRERAEAVKHFAVRRVTVETPYVASRPRLEDLRAERADWQAQEEAARAAGDGLRTRDCRAMVERLTRAVTRWSACPPGETFPYQLCLMRIGDAIWIAGEGELYQLFQTELRTRFPRWTIVPMMLGDGWRCSYLPTRETYGKGIYQEQIAMLAPGCLEGVIEAAALAIAKMTQGH